MSIHTYVNSEPTGFDSNCKECGGKQRDSVHGTADEVRQTTSADLQECYAEPDAGNIIDAIDARTGLTLYGAKTEAEIKSEYPFAVRMPLEEFISVKATRQNTPIQWIQTTPEQYEEMLCVLPPAVWTSTGFMVGEADDHDARTGRPRYRAYIHIGGQHYVASRPMTIADFKTLTPDCILEVLS